MLNGGVLMESAIIFLVLVVMSIYAIKSYAKRLAHGCCGAGNEKEGKIRVQDKNTAHYPYCVKIKVDGMTCSHCKLKVENALNAKRGIWAKVDLQSESAFIRMKEPFSKQDLCDRITGAGYGVTDIELIACGNVCKEEA